MGHEKAVRRGIEAVCSRDGQMGRLKTSGAAGGLTKEPRSHEKIVWWRIGTVGPKKGRVGLRETSGAADE